MLVIGMCILCPVSVQNYKSETRRGQRRSRRRRRRLERWQEARTVGATPLSKEEEEELNSHTTSDQRSFLSHCFSSMTIKDEF